MKLLIGGVNIAILKFRLVHVNVYTFCHVMSCIIYMYSKWKNTRYTNENSLETSLSAVKFCLAYHRVPWNFTWTIMECCVISLKLRGVQWNIVVAQTIGLKKYRWKIVANGISLIIAYYRRKFAEICLHYFCTILGVCTGHGKPGKSWNLLFQFPGL